LFWYLDVESRQLRETITRRREQLNDKFQGSKSVLSGLSATASYAAQLWYR
jgi:hypothetical protein